jgi:hypothetical protein
MALWTPSNYAAGVLHAWHDPSNSSNLSVTSGSVNSDTDLSGNSRTESQTGTNRPTVSSAAINSLDAESFASTQFFNTGIVSGPTLRSIIWVIKPTTLNAFNAILAVTGSGGFEVEVQSNGAVIIVAKAVAILATGTAGAVVNNTVQILTTTWNDSTGAYSFYVNGTAKGSGTAGHPSFGGVSAQSTVSYFQSTDSFIGLMGERVTLDDVTLSNIQLAEGYLAWKWGTVSSLDASHPYKGAAPTVADVPFIFPRNRHYVRR